MAKFSYYTKKVYEFHKKFGHPHPSTLQTSIDQNQIKLRQSLILEEGMEIIKGLGTLLEDKEAGIIEIADGIADTIYVAAGTIVAMGGHLTQGWFDSGLGLTFGIYDDAISSKAEEKKLLTMSLFFSSRILKTCEAIEDFNDNGPAIRMCQELIAYCIDLADAFNIPAKKVFDEVHKSNMSKVWPDGSVKLYKRGAKKGKVKKPKNYKKPDIAKVLSKHSKPRKKKKKKKKRKKSRK